MSAQVPSGVTPTYAQQYRRCGKPSCPLCTQGGRGHGPYWYAYWREDGRTRSKYLGKPPPPGVVAPAAPASPPAAPNIPHPTAAGVTRAIQAPPTLRAQTLGGFALWRGEERLATGRWERRREGALLKWLLGAPGHRLTRDAVLERFWPEGTPERGTANVRVLVHRLRAALGEAEGRAEGGGGALRYDGEVLALAPRAPGWLDAESFETAARTALAGRDTAACRAALALYSGEYLPGDAYAEWALGRREELRGVRLALLEHLAGLCGASGAVEEAEGCLRGVLAADPCREETALALMRLLAAAGRPGQALRVYRRLAEALREDLGLAPECETRELARTLAAQQPAAPALPAPQAVPHNLPAPLTSFIGRRRELAGLRALLGPMGAASEVDAGDAAAPCRLLTLVGPGGVGKTRLALRLADDLLDAPGAYPDGVWLVELASLADPALVTKAVAQALGVQEEAARPLAETLAAHLKGKRLLLVLDNCEHLLDACAELSATLLPACPGLRLLATSRAPLGVPGEVPWPVPALSLPDSAAGLAARLLESEAARLFLDRARVQRPELGVTERTAVAVAHICRQVDGIPLALELAAARVGVLGLEQIAARLGESLRLLAGGPRTAPARQRTLRATLDWSYQLLSEPERVLLRRLGVFVGGCSLEAAEAVCAGEGVAAEEVLDLLGGLARHSLLGVDEEAGAARYRLLEPVRQYAAERLAASGEQAALEQRHTAYYIGLAEEAEPALTGAEQAVWLARLAREHDNLRAVLRRALERGEQQVGLRMAGALWLFWYVRGYAGEGRKWLAGLLSHGSSHDVSIRNTALWVKALNAVGSLAYAQGDYAGARLPFEEGLALCRQLGDKDGCARALHGLGTLATTQGDYAQARALLEEGLALRRGLGDKEGIARSLTNLGNVAYGQGDFARAKPLFEESLTLCRELGDSWSVAVALHNLGNLIHVQGDSTRSRPLLEEGLALFRELGDRRNIAVSLTNLGNVAYGRGDFARAKELHLEGLALCQELGNASGTAESLEGMARVTAALESAPEFLVRAVRLLGAAAALREATGEPVTLSERAAHEQGIATVRAAVGETAWAAAWEEGQALTLDRAISLALAEPSAP